MHAPSVVPPSLLPVGSGQAAPGAPRRASLAVMPFVAPDEALAGGFHDVHETLFTILVVVVLLHVAAALWHHVFRGDATLARMLPRGWIQEGHDR
mgnify:CR=1 FL=1